MIKMRCLWCNQLHLLEIMKDKLKYWCPKARKYISYDRRKEVPDANTHLSGGDTC